MAVALPNSRPVPRRAGLQHILDAMTRTPAQLLGEPPLPGLPPRRVPPSTISYEAALAITRSFAHPSAILQEDPLPRHLPPRKLPTRRPEPDLPPLAAASTPPIPFSVPKSALPPSRAKKPDARLTAPANRKLKPEPPIHKSLKVTGKLPKKVPTAFRSVPPDQQQLSAPSNPDDVAKPALKSKEPRLRSSPAPLAEPTEFNTGLRSSPAPFPDSKPGARRKDRPPLRSSPAPLRSSPAPLPPASDRKDARREGDRPARKASPALGPHPRDSRDGVERPKLRSSPAEYFDSKGEDRPKLRSSPATRADPKGSKGEAGKPKSQRSTQRQGDAKVAAPKAAKRPPPSVPLSRPVARVPRSEPAPRRSVSPEPVRKPESSKHSKGNRYSSAKRETAASRKSAGKERRGQKNGSRRRDSSVERSDDDGTEMPRRRRGSSPEPAPRSKPRDSGKRRKKAVDDGFSDGEQVVSRSAGKERGTDGDKDYERIADREKPRAKGKRKERKGARESRKRVEREGDVDAEVSRDKRQRRERGKVRVRDDEIEGEIRHDKGAARKNEKYRDEERVRDAEKPLSKNAEKSKDRGLKRDPEWGDDIEERERKTMRKEHARQVDAAKERSKDREDTAVPKAQRKTPVRGPISLRSEPVDKVLAKANRETKNGHRSDASPSEKEKQRTRENTPRKCMFRSVPANAILESAGAGGAKQSDIANCVSRGVKEAASPASTQADMLPRPTPRSPSREELRLSARKLEQLASEQRELLSQFDSLSKLCDSFLLKEKHDDFEETTKKAFGVLFKYCLKKETEMRLRRRTNREWREIRKETLTKYKHLTRQFGTQRISELEKLGRSQTALFLSHQVHKVYVRMFILQRCWNKDLRNGENEMRSLMSHLHGEGAAVDKNKALTPRKVEHIASMLKDYSNIVCLLDILVSDWTDGDDEAGFEMVMPSKV